MLISYLISLSSSQLFRDQGDRCSVVPRSGHHRRAMASVRAEPGLAQFGIWSGSSPRFDGSVLVWMLSSVPLGCWMRYITSPHARPSVRGEEPHPTGGDPVCAEHSGSEEVNPEKQSQILRC